MKKFKTALKYFFACALFLGGVKMTLMTTAKMSRVSSVSSFNRALDNYPLNVVMFYRVDKKMRKENKKLYNEMRQVEKRFRTLSKDRYFSKGNVQFISANVGKKDLEAAADSFNVSTFPTFILFKDDRPLQGARKVGFMGRQELKEFIDKYFDKDIQKILKRKKELAELEWLNRPYYGWYGGWGWGYPGYYGYGWGYPYYGYGYYGPGFGVSFGF